MMGLGYSTLPGDVSPQIGFGRPIRSVHRPVQRPISATLIYAHLRGPKNGAPAGRSPTRSAGEARP